MGGALEMQDYMDNNEKRFKGRHGSLDTDVL